MDQSWPFLFMSNSTLFLSHAHVEAPVIVTQTNLTKPLDIGDDVALSCTAVGDPRPSFQWYKDGALLVNESLTFITSEKSDVSSPPFTISILYLCTVDEFNLGIYSCQAANFVGNTSYEFEIQLNFSKHIADVLLTCYITNSRNVVHMHVFVVSGGFFFDLI